MESYNLSFKKIRTFLRKDTVVFLKGAIASSKKYYRFIKKILPFYQKDTIVLLEKYYRFPQLLSLCLRR